MSVDHLFLDQEAVPTLVEVKRSEDTRARREVVAQMLDYAANATTEWSADTLAAWLEARCEAESTALEETLGELEHDFTDDAKFWSEVDENLRGGKVRLIFVSDAISANLRRIIEFLNERMTPTEVLAAEVRQYVSSDGKRLLQARLVGATARAREVKKGTQRPAVIDLLVEHGHLREGDALWLAPVALPTAVRPLADDERLRLTLSMERGRASLLYRPDDARPVEELTPSTAWNRVRRELDPSHSGTKARAVHDAYTTEPNGKTLGELAVEQGLWEPPTARVTTRQAD
jgi:hypothetical protein